MKKIILTTVLIMAIVVLSVAQNVGVNTKTPQEHLHVKGNLLVNGDVSSSNSNPTPANTFPISDTGRFVTDSVYRIYDPGGTGNYAPNTTKVLTLVDSSYDVSGKVAGLELQFETIQLGDGDSIYVFNNTDYREPALHIGSNYNGKIPPKFSGIDLVIAFISNADANVGAGFSAIVRRLFLNPNSEPDPSTQQNYGGSGLFFQAATGSFKAGINNSSETGNGAVALGVGNHAYGKSSIAIGEGGFAQNEGDVAIGSGGYATGGLSVAIGNADAMGSQSLAFGNSAQATGIGAAALSPSAHASGASSVAIGDGADANGVRSLALTGGYAGGDYSLAFGQSSGAGKSAIAMGTSASASGENSIALGNSVQAQGMGSVSIGNGNQAGSSHTICIGNSCSSIAGSYSVAIGNGAIADGNNSVAIGYAAQSGADYGCAFGNDIFAGGVGCMAIGNDLTASGVYSTAMGNYVSTNSFTGAFILGDRSTTTVMSSSADNTFRARFAAGYRLYTNSTATVGSVLGANQNAWAVISDVRLKENFVPVDGEKILHQIASMPQYTWNYKGQDVKTLRHYGPMAQDFFKSFGKDAMGEIGCDTLINQQDFLGVSLVAIQALEKRTNRIEEQQEELMQLKNDNAVLKKQNEKLKARLDKIEALIEGKK